MYTTLLKETAAFKAQGLNRPRMPSGANLETKEIKQVSFQNDIKDYPEKKNVIVEQFEYGTPLLNKAVSTDALRNEVPQIA